MASVRLKLLRMGRSEQICRNDERAEGVVCRGGEDRGTIWRPLSAFEVVALIVVVRRSRNFFDGCLGYAALVEVYC